jgi:quinohemoprotein ethanol dehydrogenase
MNVRALSVLPAVPGAMLISFLWSAPAPLAQSRRVDDAALRTAGGDEWLTYGLTQGETRFSPLKDINATNVKRLSAAWSYEVGSGGGGQEATPLVWNNTIYSITNWSIVFAVDAKTGKERWRWDPEINQTTVRSKICCGVVNRGLAIYNGMVIAPAIDGRLVALDAATGRARWEARVAYPQDHYTLTMAPRIAKGKVIIGASGGDRPTRGFFAAFDANTGHLAWRFYTVPGDPSKPFENAAMKKAAATWDGEWWRLGGGGAVWDGLAYDPEADLIYVGTGNAEPWAQTLRTATPKDNLYVCSILAVSASTGELKWH